MELTKQEEDDKRAFALLNTFHKILHKNPRPSFIKVKENKLIPIKAYANGACHGIQIGDYLYIQQNPNKSSVYAIRARVGSKITWLIHTPTNRYLGFTEGNV